METFRCPTCGRPFRSQRTLTSHRLSNPECREGLKSIFGSCSAEVKIAAAHLPVDTIWKPKPCPYGTDDAMHYDAMANLLGAKRAKLMTLPEKQFVPAYDIKIQNQLQQTQYESDEDQWGTQYDSENELDEDPDMDSGSKQSEMLLNFRAYAQRSKEFAPLDSQKLINAITLLQLLRRKKASLDTYEEMMRWHLEAQNLIRPRDSLAKSPHFMSRKQVYDLLRKRYNRNYGFGIRTEIVLPGSKSRATMITNIPLMVIQQLLLDPRVRPEDYLFNDPDDPFAPPSEDLNYIADLNTGQSYIQTWHRLITKPGKQILCPIILYIDGAATGQFVDLPITAVKIALGIHTRLAREKPHFWGTIGYIPQPTKIKSGGQGQLVASGHHDGTVPFFEMMDNEAQVEMDEAIKGKQGRNSKATKTDALQKAQDLHAMLDHILAGLVELQKKGLKWDLVYNGRCFENVEFVFFVPFIRCDTDEADRLCGSYTNRTKNVAQLCRYCLCPTNESDNIRAKYAKKTPKMIGKLVKENDTEGLRKLSQHNIDNAFYKVRFGMHSDQGVHGACPLEVLHATLLGHFALIRDTFFEQIGETSRKAKTLNTLASEFGRLLSRQSDRDMPKTKFSAGIRRGKLMAKEYTGIILVLLFTVKSTRGQTIMGERSKHFQDERNIANWIMLLETCLQWASWLQGSHMQLKDVKRCRLKFPHIMYLMKRISGKQAGMGLKTTKFHCILHMPEDMLAYGVPMEVDTRFNEMHHKPSKAAAALTQKDKAQFEKQVHERLEEVHLLQLAAEEMEDRGLQYYLSGHNFDEPEKTIVQPDKTGGRGFLASIHPKSGRIFMYDPDDKSQALAKTHVEMDLIEFMVDLQTKVWADINCLKLFTLHRRNGMIFRGSACFRGSVWRDWVVVDWGRGYGKLPSRIWGFVDLSRLRRNSRIEAGGINNLQPGVYAVVECSQHVPNPKNSELITEIQLEVGGWAGNFVSKIKFYLADVEAFVSPTVVVPNIGGPNNSYMWLKARQYWSGMFVEWLHSAHDNAELSDSAADTEETEEDDSQAGSISVASTDSEEELSDDSEDDDDSIAELNDELDR